jgi:hypothetical protein
MSLMAVAFTDHSPDRVFVGTVQFVAHDVRRSHPGYPSKFLGSIWIRPIADIGPLGAEFFYAFPYSSEGDQLLDAPIPVSTLYLSPYTRDDAGGFQPSYSGAGRVDCDEIRMATLYRSLEEALAHQNYLNKWLRQKGGQGISLVLANQT